jgi:hypothetical protein
LSWRGDLLEEKSLWEVFKKSPGVFASKFNLTVTICVAALSLLWSAATVWGVRANLITQIELISTARAWAVFGATFSSTILGFLIAGFTVFATTMRIGLFVQLAQIPAPVPNSSISRLKFIFFNFINAFVHYVAYLSASVLVVFLSSAGGIASIIFRQLDQFYDFGRVLLLASFFVGYSTWTAVVLLKLKSFVWNVYGGIMFSIATFEDPPPQDPQSQQNP